MTIDFSAVQLGYNIRQNYVLAFCYKISDRSSTNLLGNSLFYEYLTSGISYSILRNSSSPLCVQLTRCEFVLTDRKLALTF